MKPKTHNFIVREVLIVLTLIILFFGIPPVFKATEHYLGIQRNEFIAKAISWDLYREKSRDEIIFDRVIAQEKALRQKKTDINEGGTQRLTIKELKRKGIQIEAQGSEHVFTYDAVFFPPETNEQVINTVMARDFPGMIRMKSEGKGEEKAKYRLPEHKYLYDFKGNRKEYALPADLRHFARGFIAFLAYPLYIFGHLIFWSISTLLRMRKRSRPRAITAEIKTENVSRQALQDRGAKTREYEHQWKRRHTGWRFASIMLFGFIPLFGLYSAFTVPISIWADWNCVVFDLTMAAIIFGSSGLASYANYKKIKLREYPLLGLRVIVWVKNA